MRVDYIGPSTNAIAFVSETSQAASRWCAAMVLDTAGGVGYRAEIASGLRRKVAR